jgi:apolipoprotein N-acyltransferase
MPRAIISAVLLALPFHYGECWPLAFVAFIPLFFAIEGKTPQYAFIVSYVSGIFFHLMLAYWLASVSVLGLSLLTAYLALYFGFFGMGASYFLQQPREAEHAQLPFALWSLFAVPSIWVVTEWVKSWMISGLPWALLSYSQWKDIPFIQIADVIGPFGVSFLVMLVNFIGYKFVKDFMPAKKGESKDVAVPLHRKRYRIALGSVLAGVCLVTFGYGFWTLSRRDAFYASPLPKAKMRISVVQGNIPQDQKWDAKIKDIIFEKYKRLTLMSAVEKSDLIVWPETSFPGFIEDEPVMASQLRNMVRQSRTDVLVGAPTIGNMDEGLKFYNSAILFGPNGEEKGRYHKLHLVPFGEYVPFEPLLGFIRTLFSIGHFSEGDKAVIFSTPKHYQDIPVMARYGITICFEDIFPGLVRRFKNEGADFLVNMTNDAWFGKTRAPYQHAQGSIFRAVENRINVVRAANTGLSCFISPEGRIVDTVSEKGKEIFVTGRKAHDIVLRREKTFYTRFGDWFVALSFVLIFLAFRKRPGRVVYSEI